MRHMLRLVLEKEGYQDYRSRQRRGCAEVLDKEAFSVILCDIRMPGMDGMAFLQEMRKRRIDATLIMMSAYGSVDTAIECLKAGAYDYISKALQARRSRADPALRPKKSCACNGKMPCCEGIGPAHSKRAPNHLP
jgi:DNA-binding NtrC family response regulator